MKPVPVILPGHNMGKSRILTDPDSVPLRCQEKGTRKGPLSQS